MRGRRRRNRPSSLDEQRPGSESDTTSMGGGAVKLVENPPSDEPGISTGPAISPPVTAEERPLATEERSLAAGQTAEAITQIISQTGANAPTAANAPSPVSDEVGAPEQPADNRTGPVEPLLDRDGPDLQASVVEAPVQASADPAPVVEDTLHDGQPAGEAQPGEFVAVDDGVQAASGNPLPRVMAVANQKGGVGKTTTSVNLGAALAELGFRVLVIDLDPQGNATTGLGIDARNFELSMYDVLMRDASLEDCVEPTSMKNLFVAPATIALAGAEIELVPAFSRELKLKRSIEPILDDFDYVLIDCPPSLGLITVNALAAADEVLVPIQCEYYALEGLSQLMRNVHLVASNLNPKLDISTIVLTMYDARTKLADQVAQEVRKHFGAKVCRNVIPRTVRLSEAPSFGQPITTFDPASRGAIAYRELAKEVSGGTS
jgi:chromosome partitioning protein